MRILSKHDYNLLVKLCEFSEKEMLKAMYSLLSRYYNNIYYKKDKYVIAASDTNKIGVVAHCDTVFMAPPDKAEIYYDNKKNVVWSPEGLGADDRAGIFIILKLLQKGLRPTIIFTTGEENGGLGANEIITDIPTNQLDLKFLIQLDRRGSNDCVFYSCDNKEFIQLIESYGFSQKYGTFSDISYLAPAWGIAATNLSVGYIDEHSYQERLFVSDLYNTYDKVVKILENEPNLKKYEYIEKQYGYDVAATAITIESCKSCDTLIDVINEGIPIVSKEGKIEYYCPECFSKICGSLDWCIACGLPYLGNDTEQICEKCRKEIE